MKGIVYIFTNPAMPDWVKIGYTENEDISQRLKELNSSTAVPLSFRVYATLICENPRDIEQSVHNLFDQINKDLHSIEMDDKGRKRVREFFKILPEKAYSVMKEVAKLSNNENSLKRNTPTEKELEEEHFSENDIEKNRRSKVTFEELEIPVGAELTFIYDETKKCRVKSSERKIAFVNENGEEEETSLSAISKKLLNSKYRVNGYKYWTFDNDESLWNRRLRLEEESENDEDEKDK